MNCPRCGSTVNTACLCEFADSDCIEFEVVDGVVTPSIIIDPVADNIVECGPDGLFAAMADRFTIATIRRVRTTTQACSDNEAIEWTATQYDYSTSMEFSSSEVEIPFDGKWRMTAYGQFNDNDGSFVTLRLEADTGSGYAIVSASREQKDASLTGPAFITHVDEMELDAGDLLRMTVGKNATSDVDLLAASFVVSYVSD